MRSILITGCRSGIGLEFVKQLLELKTTKPEILIATVRKIKDAPELNELASTNKNLHILELDLHDFHKYTDFASQVSNIVGDKGLNVLFHNAGIIFSKEPDIESVKVDELITVFKTNSVAPIILTQTLLPLLRKAASINATKPIGIDRAAVVNMSSFLGSITSNTTGGYWGYRESKAAANMSIRTMTTEFSKDGIATLILHPGWVQTKMGGPDAILTTTQSVSGMMPILLGLSEKTNGKFISHDGKNLYW